MPSLTRQDAITRAATISVDSYDVDLDLTRGDDIFGSTVDIRFTATAGAQTFVEIVPHRLHRIRLNGAELPTDALNDGRYRLTDLAEHNTLTVEADMDYSRSGEGLHRFVDPEDGLPYTYMMGFLDMASRVFACFEQPDLKAPYRLKVTAPPEWTVVANEAGTQVSPGRWEFAETKPLATYFVCVVAGPYHSIRREHDGVRFGVHARQSYREALEADADELFEVTFGCWDRFHELYGVRYAFGDTYDQCFVPEFNAGAMENPGCVTFRDEAFMFRSAVTVAQRERRAVTMAHEMAHMWFGDLVTMTWWDDLWLNESFANCMGERGAAEGTRYVDVAAKRALSMMVGIRADQRPSTHPVSGDVPESGDALANFDGISYSKGGAILNQLSAALGDDVYFAGLRRYFERFRYGNASLADLIDCLSEAAGRDLTDWARVWMRTSGPNTLRLDFEVRDGAYAGATLVQTAATDQAVLRPHHLRVGLYRVTGGGVSRTETVTVDVDGERTPVPELDGLPVADLTLVNDQSLAYAKTRLDERSLEAVPRVLAGVDDALTRSILWVVLVDMVDDGELSPDRYLDVLAETLAGETQIAQVESQLQYARYRVVDQYLPPERRADALARVRDIARSVGAAEHAGADARLAAWRFAISCATTKEDVEELRGLSAVDETRDGVVVDDELRWDVLTRLAVLGAATEDDIRERLAADASSQGHRRAETCRAALPDTAAKETAWKAIMTGTTLSNSQLRAVADGFWWPEQMDLTAEYVDRYFDEAAARLATRMPWEIMQLGQRMFPRYRVTDSVVESGRRLLADEDLNPLLRRVVLDTVDDLARAVRVRRGAAGV